MQSLSYSLEILQEDFPLWNEMSIILTWKVDNYLGRFQPFESWSDTKLSWGNSPLCLQLVVLCSVMGVVASCAQFTEELVNVSFNCPWRSYIDDVTFR